MVYLCIGVQPGLIFKWEEAVRVINVCTSSGVELRLRTLIQSYKDTFETLIGIMQLDIMYRICRKISNFEKEVN